VQRDARSGICGYSIPSTTSLRRRITTCNQNYGTMLTASFTRQCAGLFAVAQLRQVQLQRLQAVVRRAYEQVPLFAGAWKTGLSPRREIAGGHCSLPFTVKTDLRDAYPFGLFASPMQDVVRLHASSGTTGKPIVVAYTQRTSRCGPA